MYVHYLKYSICMEVTGLSTNIALIFSSDLFVIIYRNPCFVIQLSVYQMCGTQTLQGMALLQSVCFHIISYQDCNKLYLLIQIYITDVFYLFRNYFFFVADIKFIKPLWFKTQPLVGKYDGKYEMGICATFATEHKYRFCGKSSTVKFISFDIITA